MRIKKTYILAIIVLYMFAFQFGLMQINSIFAYCDELYAVLSVPLFVTKRRNNRIRKSRCSMISMFLALYVAVGLAANMLFNYQQIIAILIDILLQLKFFLGIATTYYLFHNGVLFRYGKQIKQHAKVIITVLFVLVIVNKMLKIFPNGDSRFGISSEMLFFGHPTGLASVSFFLILIIMLFYNNSNNDKLFFLIGMTIVLSSLRFKAIAATLLLCYIFFVLVIRRGKMIEWKMLPFLPVAFAVGWEEFYGYFLSPNTMNHARGALFHTSIKIAKDFFPVGAGLGTFASDPSGKFYSPMYIRYGIQNVWGLEMEQPFLVTDTFWPMVVGQTGVLGLVLYVTIIIQLFRMASSAQRVSRGTYIAAIGVLVYLLVSSIAESSFVNPLSLPLSFIFGLVLCRIELYGSKIIAT